MLARIYRGMSLLNKELILKLLLCTLLSALYSWLVGDIYSVTAVVTANLFLHVDRGYCGSLRYAGRRVLVQIVQGALVLVIILPCKYWLHLPVPDIALFTAASLFGIAVGMPINYKYQFSPLNATLANATFIIAIGVLNGLDMLPYRVLHCAAGAVIGYVVNFVLMPQRDRYQEAARRGLRCTELSLRRRTDPVFDMDSEQAEEYRGCKQLLSVDITFLAQDNEKGLRRHKRAPEALSAVRTVYQLLDIREDLLLSLKSFSPEILEYPAYLDALSQLERAETLHLELARAWAHGQQPGDFLLEEPSPVCLDGDFVIFSSYLIQYIRLLRQLHKALRSMAPAALPSERAPDNSTVASAQTAAIHCLAREHGAASQRH